MPTDCHLETRANSSLVNVRQKYLSNGGHCNRRMISHFPYSISRHIEDILFNDGQTDLEFPSYLFSPPLYVWVLSKKVNKIKTSAEY